MNISKIQLIDILSHLDKPHRCKYCQYHYQHWDCTKMTCNIGIENFLHMEKNIDACLKSAKELEKLTIEAEQRKVNNDDKVIYPKEFAEKMREIYFRDLSVEDRHIAMDELMQKTLNSLGYSEGCSTFIHSEKWYA